MSRSLRCEYFDDRRFTIGLALSESQGPTVLGVGEGLSTLSYLIVDKSYLPVLSVKVPDHEDPAALKAATRM